jgi:hypothetical protein
MFRQPQDETETKKAFVSENASDHHVTNSLSPTENMNVASATAKHVKPSKRSSIFATRSH